MSLATFHIEIFSKYKEPLASHGITYERYERYCQAVESYALEKSRKLSRCEIIMCNDRSWYSESSPGNTGTRPFTRPYKKEGPGEYLRGRSLWSILLLAAPLGCCSFLHSCNLCRPRCVCGAGRKQVEGTGCKPARPAPVFSSGHLALLQPAVLSIAGLLQVLWLA